VRLYGVDDDRAVWHSGCSRIQIDESFALRLEEVEPGYLEEIELVFDADGREYRTWEYPLPDQTDVLVVAEPTGKNVRDEARQFLVSFVSNEVGFSVNPLSFEELLGAVDAFYTMKPGSLMQRIISRVHSFRDSVWRSKK
jgi:hypothetical protein